MPFGRAAFTYIFFGITSPKCNVDRGVQRTIFVNKFFFLSIFQNEHKTNRMQYERKYVKIRVAFLHLNRTPKNHLYPNLFSSLLGQT